ncbi:TPA: hypothetical protein ACH3X1_001425 [Trebouxia sp. C0004]
MLKGMCTRLRLRAGCKVSQVGDCLISKSTGLDWQQQQHAIETCCADLGHKLRCKAWFEVKNELKQYLSFMNPMYAK